MKVNLQYIDPHRPHIQAGHEPKPWPCQAKQLVKPAPHNHTCSESFQKNRTDQRKTGDGSADLDLEEQSASFPEIGNNEAWALLRLSLMRHSAYSVTVKQA